MWLVVARPGMQRRAKVCLSCRARFQIPLENDASGLVADFSRDFFKPSRHVACRDGLKPRNFPVSSPFHVPYPQLPGDKSPTSPKLPLTRVMFACTSDMCIKLLLTYVSWGSFGEVGVMEFGLKCAACLINKWLMCSSPFSNNLSLVTPLHIGRSATDVLLCHLFLSPASLQFWWCHVSFVDVSCCFTQRPSFSCK